MSSFTAGNGDFEEGADNDVSVSSLEEPSEEQLELLFDHPTVGTETKYTANHTKYQTLEDSGRVGGVGRDVEVEVKLFFEERDLCATVGKL